MRAGTPAARIRKANAEEKCSQKPLRVSNRNSSIGLASSSGGVRLYSRRAERKCARALRITSVSLADSLRQRAASSRARGLPLDGSRLAASSSPGDVPKVAR